MKLGQRQNRQTSDVEIDLAPMIDCVFILLIFFIVTSVFIQDPGIRVERPEVEGNVQADHESLVIAISSADEIYFDGQPVAIEDLDGALKNAFFGRDTSLVIRADRKASHGIFAEVHSAATKAGIRTVQFSTEQGP